MGANVLAHLRSMMVGQLVGRLPTRAIVLKVAFPPNMRGETGGCLQKLGSGFAEEGHPLGLDRDQCSANGCIAS